MDTTWFPSDVKDADAWLPEFFMPKVGEKKFRTKEKGTSVSKPKSTTSGKHEIV